MKNDAKRYYAILGVAPESSDEEIRAAFRRRAKELHPDSEFGDAGDFIRLKKAYDVVSDSSKRAHYDRLSRPRQRYAPELSWAPVSRPRRYRIGGMSVARFAAAFVLMGGLSIGALEVVLDEADVPLSAVLDVHGSPPRVSADVERKSYSASTPPRSDAVQAAMPREGETQAEYEDRVRRDEKLQRPDGQALSAPSSTESLP